MINLPFAYDPGQPTAWSLNLMHEIGRFQSLDSNRMLAWAQYEADPLRLWSFPVTICCYIRGPQFEQVDGSRLRSQV